MVLVNVFCQFHGWEVKAVANVVLYAKFNVPSGVLLHSEGIIVVFISVLIS